MQRQLEWELSAKGGLSEVKPRPALSLPSKKISRLLKRLDHAVGTPRRRRVGRATRKEVLAVRTKITHTDLNAIKRLRRVALRRCRAGLRRSSILARSLAPSSDYWGDMEVQKDG